MFYVVTFAAMLASTFPKKGMLPDRGFVVAPPSKEVVINDEDIKEFNCRVNISVLGWNRSEILLEKTMLRGDPSDVAVRFSQTEQQTSVSFTVAGSGDPPPRQDGPIAHIVVRVPWASSLRVSNGNGKVSISDVDGSVQALSANGSITMREGSRVPERAVHLTSENGDVNFVIPSGFSGAISASASNGVVNDAGTPIAHAHIVLHADNGTVTVSEAP